MKRLMFFLFVVPVMMQAQVAATTYLHVLKPSASVDSTILNRPFLTSTSDTVYAMDISKCSSVKLAVQAQDTSTILIYYRLGLQNGVFSAWTLTDSAKVTSAAALTPKVVDFTTIASGCSWVQFVLKFDTKAFAFGTGTKKYTASLKRIQ